VEGRTPSQLEREVKLELGPTQDRAKWSPPDLQGVAPGARLEELPALLLEATYFDTPSRHLQRQRITLRRRAETVYGDGEARCSWTVKLPTTAAGAVLSRAELNWDCQAGDDPGATLVPPEEVAWLLAGVCLGEALVPIARLRTLRRRWQLTVEGGRPLSEISHDVVEGDLLGAAGGTRGGSAEPVRFDELEVELAEGGEEGLLEAIVAKLVEAGARRSGRQSKLATVLEAGAPVGRDEKAAAPRIPGRPQQGFQPQTAGHKSTPTMAEVLASQCRACLEALLAHDPPIRLSDPDPEHIHKSRVAVRKFRTVLRAFAPLLAATRSERDGVPDEVEEWLLELGGELRWLGSSLGQARDADVRLASLQRGCSELAEVAGDGRLASGGPEGLLMAARQERDEAHQSLLVALGSERYVQLLRTLEALGGPPAGAGAPPVLPAKAPLVPPQLWERLNQPAAVGMAALVRRHLRSLRRTGRSLGRHPSEAALHKLRIKAKQLRYVAEAAAPVLGHKSLRRAAEAIAEEAARLQDVLGELHDSAVNRAWLQAVAAREQKGSAAAQVAADLIGAAEKSQHTLSRRWPKHWEALQRWRPKKWR
jgi:CHAD domain-containing protein